MGGGPGGVGGNGICPAASVLTEAHGVLHEDVRHVGRHNLAQVDVICGGYPCQPYSTSGRRKGAQDHRDLWPEFARIIGEVQPRYVVIENVTLVECFGACLGSVGFECLSLEYMVADQACYLSNVTKQDFPNC